MGNEFDRFLGLLTAELEECGGEATYLICDSGPSIHFEYYADVYADSRYLGRVHWDQVFIQVGKYTQDLSHFWISTFATAYLKLKLNYYREKYDRVPA